MGVLSENRFQKAVLISLGSIYLLILAGALVRVTGSGMGCPDWPTCFEKLVPPTNVSEIRPDYKDYYYQKTGHLIADFNVYHTYTEYINRLIAVLTGILGIITTFFSFAYRKTNPRFVAVSFFILILLGFEGWLGKLVVNTNLKAVMVTLHMFAALLIVFFLIWLASAVRSLVRFPVSNMNSNIKQMAWLMLIVTLIQILLGTQVREDIERIASNHSGLNRAQWLNEANIYFYVHRSLSWLILFLSIWMWRKAQTNGYSIVSNTLKWLLFTFVFQMITGILMNYTGLPEYAQALHLLVGSISFGIAAYYVIQTNSIWLPKQHEV